MFLFLKWSGGAEDLVVVELWSSSGYNRVVLVLV